MQYEPFSVSSVSNSREHCPAECHQREPLYEILLMYQVDVTVNNRGLLRVEVDHRADDMKYLRRTKAELEIVCAKRNSA